EIYPPARVPRSAIRGAKRLMEAAGYTLIEGKWHDPQGQKLTIEMVDDSPAFARINNPYIENLIAAGFDAVYTQIDSAQMQQRQEDFDYDITVGRLVMSLSPSLSLRTIFGSDGANNKGTPNYSGVADPGVDALIERVIASDTREDMQAAVRALDRTLRAMHIWVPQWYKGSHNIAYWDVFGRPDIKPPYDRGVMGTWWIDQDKMDRLKAEGAL
ncbi:MAG: ABC transporter substrate-binding protein, partial [Pseudomonadota bacterium]